MAKNREYEFDGRRFHSMMDIARELGIPRLYPRDFDKYGVVDVTGQPAPEPVSVPETEEPKKQKKAEPEKEKKAEPKKTKTDDPIEEKDSKKTEETPKKKVYTIEELVKMSLAEFSKHVRKIDTDDIITFAAANKLDTAEDSDDTRIRRMKVVMAIKGKFFPNQSLPAKKTSFKGVSVDELVAFAKEKKIEYKESSEEKIQRMWVIYALNQAGYHNLPEKNVQK